MCRRFFGGVHFADVVGHGLVDGIDEADGLVGWSFAEKFDSAVGQVFDETGNVETPHAVYRKPTPCTRPEKNTRLAVRSDCSADIMNGQLFFLMRRILFPRLE